MLSWDAVMLECFYFYFGVILIRTDFLCCEVAVVVFGCVFRLRWVAIGSGVWHFVELG